MTRFLSTLKNGSVKGGLNWSCFRMPHIDIYYTWPSKTVYHEGKHQPFQDKSFESQNQTGVIFTSPSDSLNSEAFKESIFPSFLFKLLSRSLCKSLYSTPPSPQKSNPNNKTSPKKSRNIEKKTQRAEINQTTKLSSQPKKCRQSWLSSASCHWRCCCWLFDSWPSSLLPALHRVCRPSCALPRPRPWQQPCPWPTRHQPWLPGVKGRNQDKTLIRIPRSITTVTLVEVEVFFCLVFCIDFVCLFGCLCSQKCFLVYIETLCVCFFLREEERRDVFFFWKYGQRCGWGREVPRRNYEGGSNGFGICQNDWVWNVNHVCRVNPRRALVRNEFVSRSVQYV